MNTPIYQAGSKCESPTAGPFCVISHEAALVAWLPSSTQQGVCAPSQPTPHLLEALYATEWLKLHSRRTLVLRRPTFLKNCWCFLLPFTSGHGGTKRCPQSPLVFRHCFPSSLWVEAPQLPLGRQDWSFHLEEWGLLFTWTVKMTSWQYIGNCHTEPSLCIFFFLIYLGDEGTNRYLHMYRLRKASLGDLICSPCQQREGSHLWYTVSVPGSQCVLCVNNQCVRELYRVCSPRMKSRFIWLDLDILLLFRFD